MRIEKLVYTVDETAKALGISKPVAYELCNRADFPAIRVSQRRIVVPVDALHTWLSAQTKKPPYLL